MALAVALEGQHRHVVRAIAIVAFVAAFLCVLGLFSFALDALQTRSQVRAEMRLSFQVAALTAAAKTILAFVTFVAFALSGWRAGRAMRSKEERPLKGVLFVKSAVDHVETQG